MKWCPKLSLSLLLAMALSQASAVSVYQCEDDKGKRSFEAHCPPGTKPVDQRSYSENGGPAPEGPRATVTIYLVPNCDSCEQVKEFLSVRNIRPVEKNVATDVKLQEELKKKAGDLRVPVTIIGDKIVNGYNRAEMLAALEAGGYASGEGSVPESEAAVEEAGETVGEEEVAEESVTEVEAVTEEEPAVEEATPAEEEETIAE